MTTAMTTSPTSATRPRLRSLTRAPRARSVGDLPASPAHVLVSGVGTGLDLPLLPSQHRYTGIDLTHAMLRRATRRAAQLDFCCVQGDAQNLPFADHSFDHAILHLILAVLPNPIACLRETVRVLAPGGTVLIFDKFLQAGQRAPLRRLANPLVRRVATRLDVVFEARDGVHANEIVAALQGQGYVVERLGHTEG